MLHFLGPVRGYISIDYDTLPRKLKLHAEASLTLPGSPMAPHTDLCTVVIEEFIFFYW